MEQIRVMPFQRQSTRRIACRLSGSTAPASHIHPCGVQRRSRLHEHWRTPRSSRTPSQRFGWTRVRWKGDQRAALDDPPSCLLNDGAHLNYLCCCSSLYCRRRIARIWLTWRRIGHRWTFSGRSLTYQCSPRTVHLMAKRISISNGISPNGSTRKM